MFMAKTSTRKLKAGVSPVAATILLIALTVTAVGVVAAVVVGWGTPEPSLAASIDVGGASDGNTVLVLQHVGGNPIGTAFVPSASGTITENDWADMEVRVNGEKVVTTSGILNGSTVLSGVTYGFVFGDTLTLGLSTALHSGDVVTVVYRPTGQVIKTVTVLGQGTMITSSTTSSATTSSSTTSSATTTSSTTSSGTTTSSTTTTTTTTTPPTPSVPGSGWDLVWSDEFDGSSVDNSKWSYEVGTVGLGGEHGYGNGEKQYYTDGANASVDNGILTITAKKEDMGGCHYTSTRMITKDKHEFQYGVIEARIAVPMGQGLWPAFWTLGANYPETLWPDCGEIDIMEHYHNNYSVVLGAMPGGGGPVANPSPAEYHIYAIEWDYSAIRWYQDGVQCFVWSPDPTYFQPYQKPHYILLNLAVGSSWFAGPDASTPFPAEYKIDYVRVYTQLL